MNKQLKLLYVEKDEVSQNTYFELLTEQFRDVFTATTGKDGFSLFMEQKPDLIITDLKIPDMNGIEFIRAIRSTNSTTPIIVFSADIKDDFMLETVEDLINGRLSKPASHEELQAVIASVMSGSTIHSEPRPMKSPPLPVKLAPLREGFDEMLVIGIGSSAGGLEALTLLLKGLAPNTSSAYIIAQHLSPKHSTMLVDLLGRETLIRTKEAENGEIIAPRVIYITPPNKNIEIGRNNELILTAPKKNTIVPKPSVNLLFNSLAEFKKEKSIGIILSGTGSDGTQGMRAINAEGGITIVQNPTEAKYDGMPTAAINGCSIDIVIGANKIGEELVALENFPRQKVLQKYQVAPKDNNIAYIFGILKNTKKVDFSLYKKATVGRRIERRMVALKIETLTDYAHFVGENENEVELLYKDLLIGVTEFFRNRSAFTALKRTLYDYLATTELSTFRVWMPGASTGEEAYSMAIIIDEIFTELNLSIDLKIFATDIDEEALNTARRGVYHPTLLADLSDDIVEKYFYVKNDEFSVKKTLRENIVFSSHDILSDPPFKDLDLIVCRNLMIYFNIEAQKKIMKGFHFALQLGSYLFLGQSENATNFEYFFTPVDKVNKIFKSTPSPKSNSNALKIVLPESAVTTAEMSQENKQIPLQDVIASKAAKILLPNVIVTNDQLEVLYKKGQFDYLTIPDGYVSYNLYRVLNVRLISGVKQLISEYRGDDKISSSDFLYMPAPNGGVRYIKIYFIPFLNRGNQSFLFFFQELSESELAVINPVITNQDVESQGALEAELHRTKEHMQTLLEELETTNEELQSSNEEMQSANEELQATNEELETSNEELQSTNEELQTAYSELNEAFAENKQIRARLNMLNDRYKSVLQNVNDAVVVTDLDGTILRTNAAMQRFIGSNREQMLSSSWREVIAANSTEDFKSRQAELQTNGQYGPYILEFPSDDNDSYLIHFIDYVSKDEDGSVQIWSFGSDVTREKLMVTELKEREERYRNTFELAHVGIAHIGLDGRIVKQNSSLATMLSYSPAELLELSLNDVVIPEDLNADTEQRQRLIDGEDNQYKVEKRLIRKDGVVIWTSMSFSIVQNREGNPIYFICVIEDINANKEAAVQSLQAMTVFSTVQEAIVITDESLIIVDVNPAFEDTSGFKKMDLIGQEVNNTFSGDYSTMFYQDIMSALNKTGLWSGEVLNKAKNGQVYPTFMNVNSVKNSDGTIKQYIFVLTDISVIKQSQERVEFLASHDTLTGLPNRALFNDRLHHAIVKARRSKEHLAILFIDLDRFKVINDGLGHHVGDQVLIEVSDRLTKLLRDNDTVARIGGDEFVVLLEGLDSPLNAARITSKIIGSVSEPMVSGDQKIQIGCSIGISVYPIDGVTSDELVRQADIAMYDAKDHGGNLFRYTSKKLSSNAFEKASLENAIREGLERDEFEVYYQPIVDIETMRADHFESLIRWNHPSMGQIMPGKFIPIAEESDLINEISKFVIYSTIRDIQKMSLSGRDITVAINFSAKDLISDTVFSSLKQYLHRFDVEGSAINIEITERKLIHSNSMYSRHLNRYRELGVSFSMDDFGTGYSNLTYLAEQPFDVLKIDHSFISKISESKTSKELVKAIISIATALNIKTVAEGVEKEEELSFLKKSGCDYVQGFYLMPPIPFDKLEAMLIRDSTFMPE